MKMFLLFVTLVIGFTSTAQTFEGEIVYKYTYKSKIPNISDEKFTEMMGDTQHYSIKNGSYKTVINGQFAQWQMYSARDNKLYNKMSNSETIFWNDGAVNPDEVLDAQINRATTTVLGYLCDELILTCKSGIQKYYFNSKFLIDPGVFVNHKLGNWYEVVSRSKALPLKSVIDNAQYSLVSIATSIQATTLADTIFELPVDAKIMKSPY